MQRRTGKSSTKITRVSLLAPLAIALCSASSTGFAQKIKPGPVSCPAGQYVQGVNFKTNTLICADLPEASQVVAALQDKLACMTKVGPDVYFTGCNIHVRNGLGGTGPNVNGLGNLIVGYDEDAAAIPSEPPNEPSVKTGSHNVVIGAGNTYTDRGGLVAGTFNKITARYATVTGGSRNTASAQYSSVSGGIRNTASGDFSSVSGGSQNTASAFYSSVSGGALNKADGSWSSVSGGNSNIAGGDYSSVSGGIANRASGLLSSVSGGSDAHASGNTSSVSGGIRSIASGVFSSVSGGQDNTASGQSSSVSGGANRGAFGNTNWAAGSLIELF
jgi:trimeric autotransporter adhesin